MEAEQSERLPSEEMQSGQWKEIHYRLCDVAREKAALDEEQGKLLLAALRNDVHSKLGYGSFVEYVERLFGCGPREAAERLRVAHALEELTATAAALREGRLCWSAVRELTRVAIPETEGAWLRAAAGKTVRSIERLVSGRERGDLPEDPAKPELRRHVLRFEVTAETYALWREAVGMLRREVGGQLDEDEAFLMLARLALGGPKDTGRASYQVAMTVCSSCGQGFQQGRGESIAVGSDVVEMAQCDAQYIGSCDAHVGMNRQQRRASQSIPPALRREIMRRDGGRCVVPGCRCAVFLDIHHIRTRREGGGHDSDLLVVLCAKHHRLLHRGLLVIEGRVSTGLRFYHADGSVYGIHTADPQAIETAERAFAALRELGFEDGEAKRALAEVRAHVGVTATAQEMIRRALLVLTN